MLTAGFGTNASIGLSSLAHSGPVQTFSYVLFQINPTHLLPRFAQHLYT